MPVEMSGWQTQDSNAGDLTGGRIVKVAPDGTQTDVPINTAEIPGGLGFPTDVVLDQAGDIYISDTNNYRLLYVSADNSIQTTIFSKQDTVEPGFGAFGGLWIDPSGTLYITDSLNNLVVQINYGTFDLTFPGTTNVGATSAALSIQTSNIGNQSLTLENLTFPTDFQQATVGSSPVLDCAAATVLQGGQSCEIGVVFKPTNAGPKNEPLEVVNTDLNANVSPFNIDTFNLTGNAIGTISLSPTSLTFPVTVNGDPSAAQQIVIKNIGPAATVITAALGAGTDPYFSISNNGCGGTLPVNGTCTVSIVFKPIANSGTHTGTLVATAGAGSQASASMTGTNTTKSLVATPFSLNFTTSNNVPSAPQVITIFNFTQKSQKITLSGLAGTYFTETDTCGNPLNPNNGSCTVTITFSPKIPVTPTTTTTFTTVLTITGKPDTGQSTDTVTLRGTVPGTSGSTTSIGGKGKPNANIGVSASTLSFAPQSTASVSLAKTFTVTNQTGVASDVRLTVPEGYTALTSCMGLLQSGETCKVELAFKPTKPGVTEGVVTTTLYPVDGSDKLESLVTVRGTGK